VASLSTGTHDTSTANFGKTSLLEGTVEKIKEFPEHAEPIKAFYDRWEEMLGGVIEGTLDIFNQIKGDGKYKLYALTNWSAETFPIAQEKYSFLGEFEGVVVSGVEKDRKPFPSFYETILTRYNLDPKECVFIDDNARNVAAAEEMGITSIRFISPELLRDKLASLDII